MPYMYCNQQGCNETVKLPAQYCAKHQPAKLPKGVLDVVPPAFSTRTETKTTKKTTK